VEIVRLVPKSEGFPGLMMRSLDEWAVAVQMRLGMELGMEVYVVLVTTFLVPVVVLVALLRSRNSRCRLD